MASGEEETFLFCMSSFTVQYFYLAIVIVLFSFLSEVHSYETINSFIFDFFFFSCMLKMAGFNLFYQFVMVCERNIYIKKKHFG